MRTRTTPTAGAGSPRATAVAALVALTAINLLNYADRYVLAGVQELLRGDLTLRGGLRDAAGRLSDASLGTLATSFFVVYMIAAPFTGFLGDRIARKRLVAFGVLLWSAATFASGLAETFGQLLLARALVGIGEAGYAAVSPALIADHFALGGRGKALGLFYAAIPLGAALGYAIGGAVGAAHGWRTAFFVAGLSGIPFALVILALPEPRRGASEQAPSETGAPHPFVTLRALARNRPFLVSTGGMTLMTFAVGGLASWMPSFLVRHAALSPAQAGSAFGAITAGAGLLGTALGVAAGEVAERRGRGGYLLVSGVTLVLSAPLIVAATSHPGTTATLVLAAAAMLLALMNTGPLNTALVNSLPPATRAAGVAVNIFFIHLLGDALSPTLIGLVSDATGSLPIAVALNAVPLAAGGALLIAGRRAER